MYLVFAEISQDFHVSVLVLNVLSAAKVLHLLRILHSSCEQHCHTSCELSCVSNDLLNGSTSMKREGTACVKLVVMVDVYAYVLYYANEMGKKRRNSGTLVQYNLEIEASARRNHGQTLRRKKQQEQRERQSNLESTSATPSREPEQTPNEEPSPNTTTQITNPTFEPEPMANQTIRELAAAPAVQQPLCITFPQAAKASELRRSILGIQQRSDESLYDYWERFKKLCTSYPQHGPSKQTLLQYLYEGMLPMDKKMVDAASGGALVNMTPENARTLISTMAANSQQFGSSSRRVHEVSTVSLENKIDKLTDIVNSLVTGKIGATKVYGICTMPNHPTDSCPMLQDGTGAKVNAINNFPGPPQRPYNPYGNTFNLGWRNHPNMSYGNKNQNYQPRPPPFLNQSPQKPLLRPLLKKSQGRLPSQTETNSRENVSAITLRSGTVISPVPTKEPEKIEKDKEDTSLKSQEEKSSPTSERLARRDKKEEEKEILDIFKKVESNIPLLDVIRKLSGNERVNLNENISAVFQRRLPLKYKDQGMFAIPCKIEKVRIKRAICDLGASINVMPLSVYNKISTELLKETRVTVQLADRSVIYPEEVLENVLVKENDLIFPADFYIIDMENDRSNNGSEILLGRPFLSIAYTKINVCNGILTMEFDREVVKFDVYKAMKYPDSIASLNFVDIIDPLADDFIETDLFYDFCKELEDLNDESEIISTLSSISDSRLISSKPLPSILQAPQLELKQLPSHLKYEFLSDNRTLPIIISSELSQQEEEELIAVLRTYKKAIG
ncbi:hypothetical protein CXB51_003734 [Gossypium anomalum]|uniref:Retrotransposon gag domain-containing protein n=1 Tax=Gossypium anomalum TaxID=47600 RepID=A0A8J6DBR0_9ROSI|nr:hypothetical protein CXB51_003734 [Gossypium anomalum]